MTPYLMKLKEYERRNRRIARMLEKKTVKEVAEKFCITRQRVEAIAAKYKDNQPG